MLMRRVNGRYAQYYNARTSRTGHLWQNRFFACPLEGDHLGAALVYVERNPVRAGMVSRAEDYRWSSAAAHVSGRDEWGLADMQWWRQYGPANWREILELEDGEKEEELRRCTFAGRPFGSESFVSEMSERFNRYWARGRPRKKRGRRSQEATDQFALF